MAMKDKKKNLKKKVHPKLPKPDKKISMYMAARKSTKKKK